MIKGVLFDFDGTLVDSLPYYAKVDEAVLEDFHVSPDKYIQEKIIKLTLEESAHYFIKEFNLDLTFDEMMDYLWKKIEWFYEEEIPLKPYVQETLDLLKSKNIKMCIVSSGNLSFIEKAIKRLKIEDYFEGVYAFETLKIGKSVPDLFLYAIDQMGLTKDEVIVYEDALHAIETCKKASIKVEAIYDQAHLRSLDEIKAKSDAYYDTWKEIYEKLKQELK